MPIVDIPEGTYHAMKRTSASAIERFLRRRLWYVQPPKDSPTPEMLFGRYFHALTLEPHTVAERFAAAPDFGDGRTKAAKAAKAAFEATLAGRTPIDAKRYALAAPMLEALRSHEEAGPLLFPVGNGQNEATLLYTDATSERDMKRRIDRLQVHKRRATELKTTETIDPERLPYIIHRLGYHRAAALTIDGLYQETGEWFTYALVFVSVEPQPMVCVWWAEPDSPEITVGRREYRAALAAIRECERSGDWRQPIEREPLQPLRLPRRVMMEHEAAVLQAIDTSGVTSA